MTFNAGIEAAALKPCPFCGKQPAQTYQSGIFCVTEDCPIDGVHCMDAEQWNTRPSSSAPVEQREAVARDAKLLAICRVLKPSIFARGLQPLEKDGPVTRATIENTVHNANKILDAILSLPGSSRDEVLEEAAKVAERVGSPVGAGDGCGTYIPGTSSDAAKSIRALKSGGAKP